jgi:hypothetical protein
LKRVLLAGEGKTELGEWAKEHEHRDSPGEVGVLEALLRRIGAHVTFVEGVVWTRIVKYRAGAHRSPETRNVLGVVNRALDLRCDAVVFSRDRDGSVERERDIEEGIRQAAEAFPQVALAGSVAVENIEGWILLLLGEADGERVPSKQTKAELEKLFRVVSLREKVEAVAGASIEAVPEGSLSRFVHRARAVLSPVDGPP